MLPSWPPARPPHRLAAGEAHVLALDLMATRERLAYLRSLLSEDERQKADRFAFPDLRARSAAARGQLREILAAALGTDPRALQFAYGEKGKPSLPGSPLFFNVSHSGDLGLVSLALVEHGVDVELHRDRGYDDVAQRFFARAEVARLFELPPGQRGPRFFETWTAKEAFVKATGEGITVPLEDFEARWDSPGQGHIHVLRGPALGRRFWLGSIDVGPAAAAALVAEGPPLRLRLAKWGA